jgi:hypothetical protein
VIALLACWDTIKMILALVVYKRWSVYQLDMKSAFLHSELNEAMFIEQARGYDKKGVAMSRLHKLITLASNTTYKIV